jgi:XRE family transcriptional regulator, aerobic/anaerobic benzoate catabolism transcriptional regulator
VRGERVKRGMTRKMLAQQSNTSERFLAEIEAGSGNPSLLTLDAIARALGLDVFDLLPARNPDEARRRAFVHLRQLPTGEITRLLRAIEHYGVTSAPGGRERRIALIGLRGAGKSTLGAKLAESLGCPFVELDKEIERDHGAPVSTLFDVYGQATFRRYERDCLARVTARHPAAVIATAGGLVADAITFAQLLAETHVIWLKATPAEHMQRVLAQGDFRPMARNREAMNDLIAILQAREPLYARAHAMLDTAEKSIAACTEELRGMAGRFFAKP